MANDYATRKKPPVGRFLFVAGHNIRFISSTRNLSRRARFEKVLGDAEVGFDIKSAFGRRLDLVAVNRREIKLLPIHGGGCEQGGFYAVGKTFGCGHDRRVVPIAVVSTIIKSSTRKISSTALIVEGNTEVNDKKKY